MSSVEWLTAAISGAIGIAGTLLGVALAAWLNWKTEKRKSTDQDLFGLYMLLIDAKGRHFWIMSSEMRGEEPKPEMTHRFNDVRWQVADLARKIDKTPDVDNVLRALFGYWFASEEDRNRRISELIDRIGERVNPRYKRVMQEITAENDRLAVADLQELFRRQKRLPPG